jgi:hypothetical protein
VKVQISYLSGKIDFMDITPEELQHLRTIAEKLASGVALEAVTVTYEEDGEEKTITFTDVFSLRAFAEAAMAVHRKHNLEQ